MFLSGFTRYTSTKILGLVRLENLGDPTSPPPSVTTWNRPPPRWTGETSSLSEVCLLWTRDKGYSVLRWPTPHRTTGVGSWGRRTSFALVSRCKGFTPTRSTEGRFPLSLFSPLYFPIVRPSLYIVCDEVGPLVPVVVPCLQTTKEEVRIQRGDFIELEKSSMF